MTRTLLPIAGIALLLSPAAQAKSGLLFDRTSARAGETVTASAAAMRERADTLVYLLPLAMSPRWWPTYQALAPVSGRPPYLPAIRLGRARATPKAGARLRFRLLGVTPGQYVLGFYCVPCGTRWTSALPNYQPSSHGILRVEG